MNQAGGVASTPYQGYTGQEVAPINSQQQAGVGNINAAAGPNSPFIQQITEAGQPLTTQQIQQYESPYTQDVVNATQTEFNNQNEQQQSQVEGNAASQGALGGDRVGVAQALTAGQENLAQAPVIAGLENQGYTQGVQTAEQQQQEGLQSGVAGENAALTSAGAQVGAGTLEQTTTQAQDTQSMQDYYQQQGYPFQVAQWLAGIDTGVGSQMGGTTTGQTTGPAPNPWAQVAGGALAVGAVAASDRRLKENIEKVGKTNDGQTIYRFNYKGDKALHLGLMHDEVEKKHPEAAHKVGGFGAVDYRKATDDSVRKYLGGRIAGFAEGGEVASDTDPEVVEAGAKYAQSSPYQIRPNQDGTHSVINVRTGQIHFTGTPSGAQNAQASLNYRNRFAGGRIAGFAGGGAPTSPWTGAHTWVPVAQIHGGSGAPHASAPALQKPQGGLTAEQMKGVGTITKSLTNNADADPGSASNPLPGLTADDYGSWRGGRISGFADGGAPWSGAESWVPTDNITAGKGAPSASAPSLPSQSASTNPLSNISGIAGLGKAFQNSSAGDSVNDFIQDIGEWRGGRIAGFAGGGAVDPYDKLAAMAARQRSAGSAQTALDRPATKYVPASNSEADDWQNLIGDQPSSSYANLLGSAKAKGGRVKRYATGGFADGGDPTFDDRFSAVYDQPVTAGIGASAPAYDVVNPDEPYRMDPSADEKWRGRVDRDNGRDIRAAAVDQGAPVPVMAQGDNDNADPSAGVGAISRAIRAPAGGAGASDDSMAYSTPDRWLSPPQPGSAAPASAPEEAPDQGLLSRLGIHMTPELRQGLLQAGLAMMATTRGGPGSFLGAVGEGGMAGLGGYSKSLEETQKAQDNAHKQAIEDEKLRMAQETQKQTLASSPILANGKLNPSWQAMEKWKSDTLAKENWAPLPGDGIHPDRMYNKSSGEVKDVPAPKEDTTIPASPQSGFDYRTNSPHISKGDAVPEPAVIAGHSPDLLKRDAELYLTTGQLPKASVSARSDIGRQQAIYQRAVQNYGVALAESKGMNMAQMADLQRFGTKAASFPLSRQGDQTVAIGTAIRHIGALEEYAKAWDAAKGNVNAPILRQAAAHFATFLGKPEPTNLEQAASIAGPEIIKAIGVAGGGTGGERVAQEAGFRPGAATEQILGSANVARTFLAGQLPAKEAQARNVGFPHERFMDMVGPQEYDYLSAINHGKAPESAASATPATTSAHPPNAVGTKTDVNGGKWYVDKDGKAISKVGP